MKSLIAILLAFAAITTAASAQSKLPYDSILKAGKLREAFEVDGKKMIRIFAKAKDPNTKREEVIFSIVRNDVILMTLSPKVADYSGLPDDSSERDYPWEIHVPFDEALSDCALMHNQPRGTMSIGFAAEVRVTGGKVIIHNK
jgi:hypothetical protein